MATFINIRSKEYPFVVNMDQAKVINKIHKHGEDAYIIWFGDSIAHKDNGHYVFAKTTDPDNFKKN